jgi:hypothetical protein
LRNAVDSIIKKIIKFDFNDEKKFDPGKWVRFPTKIKNHQSKPKF